MKKILWFLRFLYIHDQALFGELMANNHFQPHDDGESEHALFERLERIHKKMEDQMGPEYMARQLLTYVEESEEILPIDKIEDNRFIC